MVFLRWDGRQGVAGYADRFTRSRGAVAPCVTEVTCRACLKKMKGFPLEDGVNLGHIARCGTVRRSRRPTRCPSAPISPGGAGMRGTRSRSVPGTQDRVVPFRCVRAAKAVSRTVSIDIEVDLIRQCREDWRRGETEIWRHLSLEAELRRSADGRLRLYGLPGHVDGVPIPAPHPTMVLTRFEEPGLCVSLSSAAIAEAEAVLSPATVISLSMARAS